MIMMYSSIAICLLESFSVFMAFALPYPVFADLDQGPA